MKLGVVAKRRFASKTSSVQAFLSSVVVEFWASDTQTLAHSQQLQPEDGACWTQTYLTVTKRPGSSGMRAPKHASVALRDSSGKSVNCSLNKLLHSFRTKPSMEGPADFERLKSSWKSGDLQLLFRKLRDVSWGVSDSEDHILRFYAKDWSSLSPPTSTLSDAAFSALVSGDDLFVQYDDEEPTYFESTRYSEPPYVSTLQQSLNESGILRRHKEGVASLPKEKSLSEILHQQNPYLEDLLDDSDFPNLSWYYNSKSGVSSSLPTPLKKTSSENQTRSRILDEWLTTSYTPSHTESSISTPYNLDQESNNPTSSAQAENTSRTIEWM